MTAFRPGGSPGDVLPPAPRASVRDGRRSFFGKRAPRPDRLDIPSLIGRLPTMAGWPAAVIFDFDGVIVHSEPVHCAAFQQIAAAHDLPLSEAEYYRDLIGFDDRGAFQFLLEKNRRPADNASLSPLLAEKAALIRRLLQRGDYHALPGVDAFIRSLARRRPLAICSGALREEIETMLVGIGLRDLFPVIVSADDVTVGKPDPQGYRMAMSQLAAHAGLTLTESDCLVVEDAPTVIRSVRAAGFVVLGVATTYPLDALRTADYVVASLEAAEIDKVMPGLLADD